MGEYPMIIDARPPDGTYLCDVCNTLCGDNHIAIERCYVTSWGLYCKKCAKNYRRDGKISGLEVVAVFNKGEEIKILTRE